MKTNYVDESLVMQFKGRKRGWLFFKTQQGWLLTLQAGEIGDECAICKHFENDKCNRFNVYSNAGLKCLCIKHIN